MTPKFKKILSAPCVTIKDVADELPMPTAPKPFICATKIRDAVYRYLRKEKNRSLVGIDPGVSGAYVALYHNERVGRTCLSAARDFKGVEGMVKGMEFLAMILARRPAGEAVIERVHSMPRQGVKSTFTFGRAFGKAEGHCESLDMKITYYLPQAWQKIMCKAFYLDRNPPDWRMYAELLYPEHVELFRRKKDHNTAEALMIAVAKVLDW